MPVHPPRAALRADRLEDRLTPAVFGNPWPDAGHLTASFAPDGTPIGAAGSNLAGTVGAAVPAGTWQREALRAFQSWLAPTNVNIGLVADAGAAFGSPAPVQGAADRGDIRVGGRTLSGRELASTTPFDLLGAGSGDLVVNTAQAFSAGGVAGTYDLYTVLLQEAGHALGVGNSPDPASAQYENYQTPRAGLSAGDVASVKALYGTRTPDRFDADKPNDTADKATELSYLANAGQLVGDPTSPDKPLVAVADITTPADKDFYKVKVPDGQAGFAVSLRTGGVSLLTARVTVTAADGTVVAAGAATDPTTGDLLVTVPAGAAGKTFFVGIAANTDTPFTVGAYRLAVGPAAAAGTAYLVPPVVVLDGRTNESPSRATDLGTAAPSGDARWDVGFRAAVETAADRDFYKVKTADAANGTVGVVTVWATAVNTLDPVARVYDAAGKSVAAEVLAAGPGVYSVQVRGLKPGTTYFLEVAAADPAGARAAGTYFVAFDQRATAVELPTLAAGTVTDQAKQQNFTLTVTGSRTYHFDAALTGATADTAARVTVYTAAGTPVGSALVGGNQLAGFDIRLDAGTYVVKLSAGERTGRAFTAGYAVRGILRDDPIGPILADPNAGPPGNPPPAPPPALSPGLPWWFFDFDINPWVPWLF